MFQQFPLWPRLEPKETNRTRWQEKHVSHRFRSRGTRWHKYSNSHVLGVGAFEQTRPKNMQKQDETRWNKQEPKARWLLLWCSEDILWICRTFVTAAKRHIAPQGWSAKEVAAGQNLQLTQLYVQFYVLRNTANSTRVSQNLGTGKKWHVACWTITSNKTALNNHIRDPHESIHILFTIFHSSLPVLQEERHQCSSFLSLTMDHGSSRSDGIAGVEPWVILSQRKVK